MLKALRHPVLWIRSYWPALSRPVKRAILLVAILGLSFIAHGLYVNSRVSPPVKALFSRLTELSSTSGSKASYGAGDIRWSGQWRFAEERFNREAYQSIKDSLKAGGWEPLEETAALLPDNIMGGFVIRAEKMDHTFVAHFPKSGGELRIEVAKTGEPQVSKPLEQLEITGR